MFQYLLHKDCIQVGLKAKDRDSALASMVEGLPVWALPVHARSQIVDRIVLREQYGTTAFGDGVALPHTTSTDISEPFVVLGISEEGIDYPSLDGEKVHLIFMVLLPEREDADLEKQKILRSIQSFCSDRFLRERIKNSTDAAEAFGFFMADLEAMEASFPIGA